MTNNLEVITNKKESILIKMLDDFQEVNYLGVAEKQLIIGLTEDAYQTIVNKTKVDQNGALHSIYPEGIKLFEKYGLEDTARKLNRQYLKKSEESVLMEMLDDFQTRNYLGVTKKQLRIGLVKDAYQTIVNSAEIDEYGELQSIYPEGISLFEQYGLEGTVTKLKIQYLKKLEKNKFYQDASKIAKGLGLEKRSQKNTERNNELNKLIQEKCINTLKKLKKLFKNENFKNYY